MARDVHLRFTGRSERFLRECEDLGYSARDIVARALWLLEVAHRTKRVALVGDSGRAQSVFTLDAIQDGLMHAETMPAPLAASPAVSTAPRQNAGPEPTLPSADDVYGYLEDHPDGARLGEISAYFDAPRRATAEIVSRLIEDHKARQDEESGLYHPTQERGLYLRGGADPSTPYSADPREDSQ